MLKFSSNRDPRWNGATVVCIASGPSLTQTDVDFVRGKAKVIAVNREFEMAPWADVLYGADHKFWQEYEKDIAVKFTGERWTVSVQARKEFGLNIIGRSNGDGYSIIPGTINFGGNSGYQAAHLAAYWGAKRIILLGYDMQRTDGKEHHYGRHRGGLSNGRNFGLWCRRFGMLTKHLKAMKIEMVNCSRETALRCVPRQKLESIVW